LGDENLGDETAFKAYVFPVEVPWRLASAVTKEHCAEKKLVQEPQGGMPLGF